MAEFFLLVIFFGGCFWLLKRYQKAKVLPTPKMVLQSSVVFERDSVLADLNRNATVAKERGDWDTAVNLLRQAKEREGDMYMDTKLALYLQQAGRFDESMTEFDWLVQQLEVQFSAEQITHTAASRAHWFAVRLAKIHDKARVACKRAKQATLEQVHTALQDGFKEEAYRLDKVLDQERKKERAAWEKSVAARVKRVKK